MRDIVLVHSPLVGPLSLKPTADALSARGVGVHLVTAITGDGNLPPWRDWPALLRARLPRTEDAIVVGHSMGGLLAARLAAEIDAGALVCLDAFMPPASGLVPPVEPSFLAFLQSLPTHQGRLPKWNRWWGGDVLSRAPLAPDDRAAFVEALPELPLDWLEDAFEMADWSSCSKVFVRLSAVFDEEAHKTADQGWTVHALDGTHLHPLLKPEENGGRAVPDPGRMRQMTFAVRGALSRTLARAARGGTWSSVDARCSMR